MDCFRESLRFGALSSLSSSSVDFESKGTTDVDIFWLICSDAMRCDMPFHRIQESIFLIKNRKGKAKSSVISNNVFEYHKQSNQFNNTSLLSSQNPPDQIGTTSTTSNEQHQQTTKTRRRRQ